MVPHVLGDDFARCRDRFPTGAPFGEDIRYDPVYQDLRAEVQKLTTASSVDGGSDWKSVRRWSIDILSSRSKDLTVASYLTVALFYLDGYGGLADGLEILRQMLAEDWDGIFPSSARPRNRASALEWLVTRLAPYVESRAPQPAEVPLLPALREQLAGLQETVRQRLMQDAPSFASLNSALAAGTPEAGSAAAEPAADGGTAAPPPPASTAARTAEPPIAAGAAAEEIADRIRSLVPALRQADPFSPIPYRLLRSLKWDGVAAPPPLDPNSASPGTTRIPPPRLQQRTALENLYAAHSWAALLEASEAAFQDAGGTFWLDLQRYSVEALQGLDPRGGAPAAEAIRDESARLLRRLDSLPGLHFADRTVQTPGRPAEKTIERTPFAAEETRRWLEGLDGGSGADAAPLGLPAPAAGAAAPALAPDDARAIQELLAKQQTRAAFERLQAAVERAPGARARFLARLDAARLCLQANQAMWARALLEELLSDTEAFRFEDWEPATAADLYQLLALCYARPAKRGGPPDPEAARARIETLRRKLLRLDMRAAAALEDALRR